MNEEDWESAEQLMKCEQDPACSSLKGKVRGS